jgi:hypothetical protein
VPPNEARIGDRDSLELTPVIERPRSRPPCPGRPSTDSKVPVAVALNGLSLSQAHQRSGSNPVAVTSASIAAATPRPSRA